MTTLQRFLNKVAFIALLGSFFHSANLAQAQIQDRPKAGPEQKKLEVWVGEWKYEGTLKDTPLGPGGKFAGRESIRWILDGLFLEAKGKDKGVYGGKEMTYEGVVIRWFDPAAKTYRDQSFDNDGVVGAGLGTFSGMVWTTTGTGTDSKGKKYMTRGSTTFSSDGKSRSSKSEISFDDGKTWILGWELTAKKV